MTKLLFRMGIVALVLVGVVMVVGPLVISWGRGV